MSKVQQLKKLAETLTEEQANSIIQVILQLNMDGVEPDEWEKQAMSEWDAMTEEERMEGSISHADLKRGLGMA